MDTSLEITVNGTPETIAAGCTVEKLLLSKKLDASCVVVEVNRDIVKRERYGSCALRHGDTIEILRFVGGG